LEKTDSICNILEENIMMGGKNSGVLRLNLKSQVRHEKKPPHKKESIFENKDSKKDSDSEDSHSVTSEINSEYNIEKMLSDDLLSPRKTGFQIQVKEDLEGTGKTQSEDSGKAEGSQEKEDKQEKDKEKEKPESNSKKTLNRFKRNKKKREEITKKLVYDEKDMNDKYFSFLNSYEMLFDQNRGNFRERCLRRQRELKLQNKLLDKKNRSIFKMYSKTKDKAKTSKFESVVESFFNDKITHNLNRNNKIMETKK
jgi:hypothetical protein